MSMLNNRFFLGVIEDRNDPKRMGRVRVRILGAHSEDRKINVPIDSMPWSFVLQPSNVSSCGSPHSQLVEGTWVLVMYIDENMQDPLIIGSVPGISEVIPDYEKGFSDPFGVYPRWVGDDSELSLVSNEDLWFEHPTYHNRANTRVTNIPSALVGEGERGFWSEPDLRGNQISNYPYNAVTEYEGGMIEEHDSTSYNTRITQMHQSGSYQEILDDGTKTIKIVGDQYTITLRDQKMYVQGDLSVTVDGSVSQLVKGDYILEVGGNKIEKVGGINSVVSNVDNIFGSEKDAEKATAIVGESDIPTKPRFPSQSIEEATIDGGRYPKQPEPGAAHKAAIGSQND